MPAPIDRHAPEQGEYDADSEVVVERRGQLGVLTLNRPRAVNALNAGMVETLLATLTEWAADDGVTTVLIQGAGGRGLCAGGDIVAIYRDMLADGGRTEQFWRTEYQLNALIAAYPKPYVALMDGLVLGGGVGVSAHGSVRVVTERTKLGMPETTIGFVPDVGGTHLLSRAPGEAGTHAALTAAHVDAADALFLGLADHFVPSATLPELVGALETEAVASAVARLCEPAPDSVLARSRTWIDSCYASDEAAEIVRNLRSYQGDHQEAAHAAADSIEQKSPTAVKVTLASLRKARHLQLEEALAQEYRVGLRCLSAPDFREGIRAQVIDKDRSPRWTPGDLDLVSAQQVTDFFAPLGDRELPLTPPATSRSTNS